MTSTLDYPDYWHENQRDAAPDILLIATEQRRTRLPRVCQQCGRSIAPGERYQRIVYTEDGAFHVFVSHPYCQGE